ncbi:AT-rich interactive domain-containing protein 4A isoform X2 [Cotesia glomerata]|uniref:AT-rich interactive domain-containing protein 4A isoform X2 n=1 Tax=Cotesia glomerata TaxID=32391 RepID=UPI001D00CB7B|nr:AT-rich interactive domain-containing protein 4A isoform X2 [Cotesia glomerata]
MLGDDPPYLSVGTEVSAKYKGAFCEAKIRKVVRSVKCRVTYKQGLGTATVTDDQIKGTLRVGASVEARHVDKKEFVEATITKIQDCSQYTVVFDDGDITTLRRTALCLKSGRHFAESETLDQLPLTHPEHFGNPVIGGRRGRRSRDDSSEDEGSPPRGSPSGSGLGGKEGAETEPEIGRVVCVELGDKKKKDNWFPGLVVAPTAQDTVRIRVRDDYLVRSFKDARYYTVPKKEATEFTKELGTKVENSVLKDAVTKALNFLEKNELPPHWDRDSLFGNSMSSGNSDTDGDLDSDSSDDEPREEKDHFVAQLYKFMDDRGTPINNCPMIGNEDIDLYRLFRAVEKLGGYNRVTNQNQWKSITRRLGISMQPTQATHNLVKQAYKKFLHSFEDFYRKLGCTMVNHPRGSTRKQRPGRSLIRDKDRNTPVPTAHQNIPKTEKEKAEGDDEQKEKKISVDEEKPVSSESSAPRDIVKEEEPKPIKKKEIVEEPVSGQESDINVEIESTESSSSEKSQKPPARFTPVSLSRAKSLTTTPSTTVITSAVTTATPTSTAATGKNKEESKKKTYEKKKQEGNSSSSSSGVSVTGKKEISKKDEETTKTRSKSKEDTKVKDSRETRTPSRESEKTRANSLKPRRLTDDELKKQQRGRKKREDTEKSRVDKDESSGAESSSAPCYKGPVQLGDRLKVYYGPTHESKVTYEAKVIGVESLDGSEEMNYLVHYTGWNTRYDEWIKAARIAQNFTQSQARVRRTKATPRPQTPSTSSSKSVKTPTTGLQGRRRAQSVAPTTSKTCSSTTSTSSSASSVNNKDNKESSQPARSTTPLSVNSFSSRTKSPATPAGSRPTRNTRNAEQLGIELRRRTRRMSGHTDLSVVTESEDSDAYETDTTEPERARTRSRGTEERRRREVRRRVEDRIKPDENSEVEDEKDAVNEPRRTRRLRRTSNKIQSKSEVDSSGAVADDDEDDVEDEENDENDDDDEEENQVADTFECAQQGHDEQPKGRDFDLNQIRSELKGFDKAVKMDLLRMEPENSGDEDSKPRVEDLQKEIKEEKKKIKDIKVEETVDVKPAVETLAVKADPSPSPTEDVYEFKEPEPFEFEVRNKRDSSGDKDKPKKRVFDEEPKSPKKKQKTSATSPKETKSEIEVESKRKARRTPVKRPEDTPEIIKPIVVPTPKEFEKVIEPPTLIPSKATSVTLSPPTLVSAVIEEQTKNSSSIELFNDSTSNDDGTGDVDDPEDRLIIYETEVSETENENPPSNYQQEILPSTEAPNKNEFNKKVEGNKDKEEKHVASNVPSTSGMPTITSSVDSLPLSDDRVGYEPKQWVIKPMNYKNPWGNEIKPPPPLPSPAVIDKKVVEVKPPVIERKIVDTKPPTIERKVIDAKPPTLPVITPSVSSVPPNNTEQVIFEPKQWIMKYIFNQKQPSDVKPSEIEKKISDRKSPSNDKFADIKPSSIASLTTTTLGSPIVLAPISARLPATSTIEEKLSAAAMAFRQSKPRDSKRDDESGESKKNPKDSSKKSDTHGKRARVINDEQAKLKQELEKKKEQEAAKIQEERSREAIRATLKQKEDELEQLKIHKEDLKKVADVKIDQRKIVDKREDLWKKKDKGDIMDVEVSKEIPSEPKENEKQKRRKVLSQEFVDSTDSSDSEQKLVIDNSDVKEDRHESFDFEGKVKSEIELYPEARSDHHQQVSSIVTQQEQSINSSKSVISAKTEEEGENMNLLCEEEIPGSPAPVIDTTEQERPGDHHHHHHHHHNLIKNESNEKKLVLLEMPFASAPALGPQSSTSQGSMSMTVTTTCNVPVPVLIPMQPNVVTAPRQPLPLQHQQQHHHHHLHHQQPLQQQQQPQPQLQQLQSQQQQLQPKQDQLHQQQQPVIIPQPPPEQLPPPVVHQVIQPPRRESNEAAPVMDNTPPTTPDSTISNISTSPRGDERTGGSSPLSDENIKLNRDTSEADNDSAGKAPSGYSEDDATLNTDGNTAERGSSKAVKRSAEDPASPKKKKRSRKSSECGSNAGRKTSGRHSARQTRQSSAAGSDSDDTSEGSSSANNVNNNGNINTNSSHSSTGVIESTNTASTTTTTATTNGITDLNSISSRSPKPMKYNFYVELDPQLDGSQRIALLQQRLTELKNTYNTVKLELAAIERRRKKLRRREREAMKAAKAEMQQACS